MSVDYLAEAAERIIAAEGVDRIDTWASARALSALSGAVEADSVLPSVSGDGEGGCALFWSVDGNQLEVEFHMDKSFYLRLRLKDGSSAVLVEGGAGEPFPETTLRECLRRLSGILQARGRTERAEGTDRKRIS